MPKTKTSADLHLQAVRDWSRAVLAFLMLVLVVALSLSEGRIIPAFLTGDSPSAMAPAEPKGLSKGAIYIPSPDAQTCEYRQIDNDTWRIRNAGTVPCDHTGSLSSRQPDRNTTPARLEAIRDSFFPRR